MHYLYILSFILISTFLVGGCKAEMNEETINKNSIIYYGNFAGYHIPPKPIEIISKEEAFSRNTYYMGYYDDVGKLYRFEKYLKGELFFQENYEYHDNGNIMKVYGTNPDGEYSSRYFDKKGNLLKDQH